MRETRRSHRLFPLVVSGSILATNAFGCGGDDVGVKPSPPDCKLRPSLCAGEGGVDATMDSAAPPPMDSGGMMDTGTSSDTSMPDATDSSVQDASDSGMQDSPSDGPGRD